MSLLQLLPLCLPLVLQDSQIPVPGPQVPQLTREEEAKRNWMPLDQVAIVVNSDIITYNSLRRKLQTAMATAEITTAQEFQQLQAATEREAVRALLMRQAGEDLGLPPEAVDAHVASLLRDEQDQAGGAFELSKKLREDDTTATELHESRVDELMEMSFRRRLLGYGGAGERSAEDRYIRPGKLAQRYQRIQRTGRDIHFLQRAGATPALYELQVLVLTGEAFGSLKAAHQKAQEARAALVAGEADWDELIDTIGGLPERGIIRPAGIEFVGAALDPGNGAVVQFAMEARQDVYSDVIQFPFVNQATGERQVAGFGIYKLLARTPANVPDFNLPGLQHDLQRWMESEADRRRESDAVDDLEKTAYVWYPGIEEQRKAREAARLKRLESIEQARRTNAEKLSQEGNSGPPSQDPD